MKRQVFYIISSIAAASVLTSAAEARPRHHRVAARHHVYGRATASNIPYTSERRSFRNPYPVRPQYSYEEAPYDPSYQGPGADVFRRTIQAQHEPGVTLQIDPDAKQSATGGPAGGLPSNGNF